MLHRLAGLGRPKFLTVALAALVAVGCADNGIVSPPPPPPNELTIAPASVLLAEGGTMQLLVRPDRRAAVVTWSTSDPRVAEVSSTGLVTGHRLGSAQVIAHAGSETATARVVVGLARCLLRCP